MAMVFDFLEMLHDNVSSLKKIASWIQEALHQGGVETQIFASDGFS